MKEHSLSCALALALSSLNCGNDVVPTTALMPQVSEWEIIVEDLPFPLDGVGKITQITIGRQSFQDNFANRGTVEVYFDHDEPTISLELRKYMFGDEIDAFGYNTEVRGVFDRLTLWAFAGVAEPAKPELQDSNSDCTKDVWKDNCAIYAYYDGVAQPERSGMDFRIHLPVGYRGKLLVTTEDNVAVDSYPRRGNVQIEGLCGSGEINLQSGWAKVKMCSGLTPAPTCPNEEILLCEGWPDGSASQAWSTECPCGEGAEFGELLVRALQPYAANVTIDVPGTLWSIVELSNLEPETPHMCRPQIQACSSATCTLGGGEYSLDAVMNYPSPAALPAGGFRISAISGGCEEVAFVDDPQDWKPEGLGAPPQELRGYLRLCAGCL